MLLVGDIGGTKTALALFSPEGGPRAPQAQAEFPSGDYPSLEAVVRAYAAGVRSPITAACFAVAGPVIGGQAKVTNLPWTINAATLRRDLQLGAVYLLNDLEATALAVPVLTPDDLATLNSGRAVPGGAIAVVAPGTGLGEAFLTWQDDHYRAHPSEGGHADYAPTNATELGLLAFLLERFEHASCERVISGSGLPNIYDYLRERGPIPESPDIARALAAADDRTPIIAGGALQRDPPCPLCAATLELFVAALGAEAGNLALKVLATGGVYLGGGVPRRILPALQAGPFLPAFCNKGRLDDLLDLLPVYVIRRQAALSGAASYGLDAARRAPTA
jgi:glucokinase